MKRPASALLLVCALAACAPDYDARHRAPRRALTEQIDSGNLSGDALGMAYIKRGYTLYLDEQHERALADYNSAVAAAPQMALAYAARALLLRDMGRLDQALPDADQAIALTPTPDAHDYLLRGQLRLAKGDSSGALADYDEAVRRAPDDFRVYAARGTALAGLGEDDRALPDLDRAVELVPDAVQEPDRRDCLRFGGQANSVCEAAYTIFFRSYVLRPVLEARGMIWYRRGDYKRAVPDLQEAGDEGQIPVYSALAHFAAGDCAAGRDKLHTYDDVKGVAPESVIAAHRDFIAKTPCAEDVLSD